jgi:hypothetical protein
LPRGPHPQDGDAPHPAALVRDPPARERL